MKRDPHKSCSDELGTSVRLEIGQGHIPSPHHCSPADCLFIVRVCKLHGMVISYRDMLENADYMVWYGIVR